VLMVCAVSEDRQLDSPSAPWRRALEVISSPDRRRTSCTLRPARRGGGAAMAEVPVVRRHKVRLRLSSRAAGAGVGAIGLSASTRDRPRSRRPARPAGGPAGAGAHRAAHRPPLHSGLTRWLSEVAAMRVSGRCAKAKAAQPGRAYWRPTGATWSWTRWAAWARPVESACTALSANRLLHVAGPLAGRPPPSRGDDRDG